MSMIIRSHVMWFIIYFMIAAGIGLFIRDIPGQPELFATIENFMTPAHVTKLGDPGSFALGALDIYQHGWVLPENQWLVKLWPPGFMVTESLTLKVFGKEAPFIFVLIIVMSSLVALMLSILRQNLLFVAPVIVASLLPLIPFLFPVTRFFLLQPMGIVLGEGFSIVFFMTAMFLMPLATRKKSLVYAVFAGLMLALAAYFRSQFELFVVFLTIMAIVMTAAYFLLVRSRIGDMKRHHMSCILKNIIVTLFVAHAAMMPWRLHNLYEPSTTTMSWVLTKNLVFANGGRNDQELIDAGGGWIVEGGGNVACKVEPTYCGKAKRSDFYRAFLHHPVSWFSYKYNLLDKYWFSSIKNFTKNRFPATDVDIFINMVILISVFGNLVLLFKIRSHPEFPIYIWQCLSFYVCCFSVFLLVHFEVRYFYSLKIYAIFTFVLLSAIAAHLVKLKRAALAANHAT